MNVRIWLCALLVCILPACQGCEPEAPGVEVSVDTMRGIPQNVTGVAFVDLRKWAQDMRAMSPYADFPGRWNALGDDLDRLMTIHLGTGLMDSDQLTAWVGGGLFDLSWAVILFGDYDGTLEGSGSTTIGNHVVIELEPDILVSQSGDNVVIGNRSGLEQTLAVLDGTAPAFSAVESGVREIAETLDDIVGRPMFVVAGGVPSGLGGLMGDMPQRGGMAMGDESIAFQARFGSALEATSLMTMFNMSVSALRTQFLAKVNGLESLSFEEGLQAVLVHHLLTLFWDDLLEIEREGEVVTATIEGLDARTYTAYWMMSFATVGASMFLQATNEPGSGYYETIHSGYPSYALDDLDLNVIRLNASAQRYYFADHATATGQILPHQLPLSAGPEPSEVPCGLSGFADWNDPTWQALDFAPQGPQYFSYQFESVGDRYTLYAFGDIDCDGNASTFAREYSLQGDEFVETSRREDSPEE
ncbi:MAG: hypothetical protein KC561_04770 [Myxococcales bacterium]|nr:hypothetical protein [Myxococcales bacterium]